MAITKTHLVKDAFVFDWKTKLENDEDVDYETFRLPNEGSELLFYFAKQGRIYLLHKKPLPSFFPLVFEIIGKDENSDHCDSSQRRI